MYDCFQTSNVILWSLYELACNPGIQEKIVEEFQQLGCSSNSVRFQDLREMVYLKAVVKESLRYMFILKEKLSTLVYIFVVI